MELKESYTVLMMPFSIDRERWSLPADGLWQPAELKIEGGVLYRHIQNWMQAGANSGTRQHIAHRDQNYDIYTVRTSAPDEPLKARLATWRKVKKMQWRLQKKGLGFKLVDKDNELLSTKLLVNRLSGVGVLLLTIRLCQDDMSVERLMELNYAIHKTDRQCPAIVAAIDTGTANPHQADDCNRVAACIAGQGLPLREAEKPAGSLSAWDLNGLIGFLMADVKDCYSRFNTTRLHVFTYYRINRDDDGPECDRNFMRIVRCENSNSNVRLDTIGDYTMQTFTNIRVGCTVEGGAIMTLTSAADDDRNQGSNHLLNFGNTSLPKRYLWIYVMTVLQRHTLLRMAAELTAIDPLGDGENTLGRLQSLVERMATLKVTTYFTDISDYTQHNEFYAFCVKRLGVKAGFDDVDEKMELLRTVITNRKNEHDEAKNDRLTIILAILTVASATCDALTVLTLDRWNPLSGIAVAAALSFLIIYIWTRKSDK